MAVSSGSRKIRFVMRRGKSSDLAGGDRRSSAARAILLEDRLQPPNGARELALPPRATGDQLHQAIAQLGRLRLVAVLDPRHPAGGVVQRPLAHRAHAVELAAATALEDAVGRLDLDERV